MNKKATKELIALLDNAINEKDFKRLAMDLARDGADISVLSTKRGKSLLHVLVCENEGGVNAQEIAELVKLNPAILAIKDHRGRTALQSLVDDFKYYKLTFDEFKQSAMVLARAGAEFTSPAPETGGSLLHILALNNKDGVNNQEIATLLKLNHDVLATKERGLTVLQYVVNYFPLPFKDRIQTAMILARAGADITVLSSYLGETLLHVLACENIGGSNNQEIAELLAINKDLLNCRDKRGSTPVHSMLWSNSSVGIEDVEKLLSDENLYYTADDNVTLLHASCHSGNFPIVKYLFTKGLSLTARTSSNETLLHYGVSSTNKELIQWLIKTRQIDINAQDSNGDTAFHRAIRYGNLVAVQILLENGIDASIQNNIGSKAYQIASSMKQTKLLAHLFNSKNELSASIQAMRGYGISLQNQGASKGQIVIALADFLSAKADQFFDQKPEEQRCNFNKFQLEFSELLNSKNEEMSTYRVAWDTIVKNTAIALTGVGLLLIAAQLIYSKVNEGRPRFFFQKRTTTSEKNVENVQHCIDISAQIFGLE